jgi:hypothetical protein
MTVRDSITRTRARTPGAEDDPTSATVRDRVLGPTQCGISDVATKCTKGGRKPNICRCMLGAVLSWRCLGRRRLRCQPCSRIGENPPYGMIGGIEETSASSKPDPRLDPTRLRGARDETRVPTATKARVHIVAQQRRGRLAARGAPRSRGSRSPTKSTHLALSETRSSSECSSRPCTRRIFDSGQLLRA